MGCWLTIFVIMLSPFTAAAGSPAQVALEAIRAAELFISGLSSEARLGCDKAGQFSSTADGLFYVCEMAQNSRGRILHRVYSRSRAVLADGCESLKFDTENQLIFCSYITIGEASRRELFTAVFTFEGLSLTAHPSQFHAFANRPQCRQIRIVNNPKVLLCMDSFESKGRYFRATAIIQLIDGQVLTDDCRNYRLDAPAGRIFCGDEIIDFNQSRIFKTKDDKLLIDPFDGSGVPVQLDADGATLELIHHRTFTLSKRQGVTVYRFENQVLKTLASCERIETREAQLICYLPQTKISRALSKVGLLPEDPPTHVVDLK